MNVWKSVLWIRIHLIRIRIQHNKWIRIRIQCFSSSKIAIYLTLGLQATREKHLVLKRKHPPLQKLKFIWTFFLFLWVIIALLDLDPIFCIFCEIVKWSWLRSGPHSAQPVPQRALRHLCGDLHRAVHARHWGPLSQLCVLHHPTLLHHILHCCTPRSDRTYHI